MKPVDYAATGKAVAAARDKLGLSQRKLAEVSDGVLRRSVIANLEAGRKNTLDVQELLSLADLLGVSPMSLLYPPGSDMQEALWFSGYEDDDYRVLFAYAEAAKRLDRALKDAHRTFELRVDLLDRCEELKDRARQAGWEINDVEAEG